jgi:hypothetical protein
MTLRKSLLYLLIFTTVGSFFTYRIIVKAYDTESAYDIESLER